jgi:LCCL domain
MSYRRVAWLIPAALLVASVALLPFASTAAPPQLSANVTGPTGPEIDVKFIDGSTLKVKLLDETVDLVTKHGTLKIATADIRGIDFATRIPADVSEKTRIAVLALGSPEHAVRVKAVADLKAIGPRAYAAVSKATQHEDPEVAQRAEDLVEYLKAKFSDGQLEVREKDVVHTDDSKIAGHLAAPTFRIGTFQFGELKLKLADARSIGGGPDEDELLAANAQPAPAYMVTYANQFGKTHTFKLVGGLPNTGTVWGTDQYTLDSSLAIAAVHAGILKPGETGVVRVKIVQSPLQFTSSIRNGIQSHPYGQYQGGAYEFVKRKK